MKTEQITLGDKVNALFSDSIERNGTVVSIDAHLVEIDCDGEILTTVLVMCRKLSVLL